MKDFGGDDLLDFWRFQQSGLFYHRTTLRPTALTRKDGSVVPIADLRTIAIYAGEAVDCLIRLYDSLFDDTEYVSVVIRLLNTEDRILVNTSGAMPLWNAYTSRIAEIVTERRLPLAEWRAAVVDHAVDITNEIYQRFNGPNPTLGMARTAIERTFKRQL
jgi:hypothetical protein